MTDGQSFSCGVLVRSRMFEDKGDPVYRLALSSQPYGPASRNWPLERGRMEMLRMLRNLLKKDVPAATAARMGMLRMLADWVTRYPLLVVAGWLILTIALLPFTWNMGQRLTGELTPPAHSQALEVQRLISRNMPDAGKQQLVLTLHSEEHAVGTPEFEAGLDTLLEKIRGVPGVDRIITHRDLGFERLGPSGQEYSAILLSMDISSLEKAQQAVESIRETLKEWNSAFEVNVTGLPAVAIDLSEVSESDVGRAEQTALPVTSILLVAAFGALLSALIPPLVGWIAVILALGAIALLSRAYPVHSLAQTVTVMLGLAAGIDYCLLMVTRFREEMDKGQSPREAAMRSVTTAGRAIVLSGIMVAVSLVALLFPPLNLVRSIGMAGIVVILFSVLVAVTLVPALLTLLGARINWPKAIYRWFAPSIRGKGWERLAGCIAARPGRWAAVATLFLLALGLPLGRIEIYNEGVQNLSPSVESRKGVEALKHLDLDGMLDRVDVLVDLGEGNTFYGTPAVEQAARLTKELESAIGKGIVLGPAPSKIPEDALRKLYASPPVENAFPMPEAARYISESGRFLLFRVMPEDALGAQTRDSFVRQVRDLARQSFAKASVFLGGDPVAFQDFDRALYRNFPVAVALVLLLTFLFLFAVFRSPYVAMVAVAGNLFVLAASMGALVAVFQWELGHAAVHPMVPVIVFAITFGLSMDYQVFLLSRVWEFHLEGKPLRDAIVNGVSCTARIITFAALIMGVVFATFMISDVMTVKMLGFGLAAAVLLDATIARLILMPALLALGQRFIRRKGEPSAFLHH